MNEKNKHYYKEYVTYYRCISKINNERYLFLNKLVSIYNWLTLTKDKTTNVNCRIFQNINNLSKVKFIQNNSLEEFLKLPFKHIIIIH